MKNRRQRPPLDLPLTRFARGFYVPFYPPQENCACRGAALPRMKIVPLPSFDKEGQAAASGCCRGGLKVESPNLCAASKYATTPAGPSARHSPPRLRRGAYFQESM